MLEARLKKRHIPIVYRLVSPAHDLFARVLESKARRLGIDLVDIQDGEDFLEVAVGTGLSFLPIAKLNRSGSNTGVDLSAGMLRRAQRRMRNGPPNHTLSIGDAYHLDFPDHSFDCVLNSYMFDLLPETDFDIVLAEFHRVLRPSGRIVMMNMTEGTNRFERLWDRIYSLYPPLLGGCRGVRVSPALKRAGFCEIKRTFVVQNTFPSEVIYARRT